MFAFFLGVVVIKKKTGSDDIGNRRKEVNAHEDHPHALVALVHVDMPLKQFSASEAPCFQPFCKIEERL